MWAVAGAVIALGAVPGANEDARVLVATASVVFPLCAAVAAVAILRGHLKVAALLLVVSAATPTYFAWALNIAPLVLGLVLFTSLRSSKRVAAE